MPSDSRIPELKDNLKQDAKELLHESARLVTGFFHRGFMTIRTAASRWRQFTQDVSAAADAFRQPFSLAPPMEPPVLTPEEPPIVTITQSSLEELPVGTQMTLPEANRRIQAAATPGTLQVQIDYLTADGPDCYLTELSTGEGAGSIQVQIGARVNAARQTDRDIFKDLPPTCRDSLQAQFSPALMESFEDISTRLVDVLTEHCAISNMEAMLSENAGLMPQGAQREFRAELKQTVTILRRSANSRSFAPRQVEDRPIDAGEKAARPTKRVKSSVRDALHEKKAGDGKSPAKPPKPKER